MMGLRAHFYSISTLSRGGAKTAVSAYIQKSFPKHLSRPSGQIMDFLGIPMPSMNSPKRGQKGANPHLQLLLELHRSAGLPGFARLCPAFPRKPTLIQPPNHHAQVSRRTFVCHKDKLPQTSSRLKRTIGSFYI